MRSDDIDFELEGDWERELFTSPLWRQLCDGLGQGLTALAIPESGVDTADLVNSMGYVLEEGDDGVLEVVCGSNPETGQPVPYAGAHWVGGKEGAALDVAPSGEKRSRKRRPHPTKPSPTRPWSKAAKALGLEVESNLPGGLEG